MKLLLENWRKYLNEAMLKDAIREIPHNAIISPDADVFVIHVYEEHGDRLKDIGEYSLWNPIQGVVDLEQLEDLRKLDVKVRIYHQEASLDDLKDFFAARIKRQEEEE